MSFHGVTQSPSFSLDGDHVQLDSDQPVDSLGWTTAISLGRLWQLGIAGPGPERFGLTWLENHRCGVPRAGYRPTIRTDGFGTTWPLNTKLDDGFYHFSLSTLVNHTWEWSSNTNLREPAHIFGILYISLYKHQPGKSWNQLMFQVTTRHLGIMVSASWCPRWLGCCAWSGRQSWELTLPIHSGSCRRTMVWHWLFGRHGAPWWWDLWCGLDIVWETWCPRWWCLWWYLYAKQYNEATVNWCLTTGDMMTCRAKVPTFEQCSMA